MATARPRASNLFSVEVTETLDNLYENGMDGWGKEHSEQIESAILATGLSQQQIKVTFTVLGNAWFWYLFA